PRVALQEPLQRLSRKLGRRPTQRSTARPPRRGLADCSRPPLRLTALLRARQVERFADPADLPGDGVVGLGRLGLGMKEIVQAPDALLEEQRSADEMAKLLGESVEPGSVGGAGEAAELHFGFFAVRRFGGHLA